MLGIPPGHVSEERVLRPRTARPAPSASGGARGPKRSRSQPPPSPTEPHRPPPRPRCRPRDFGYDFGPGRPPVSLHFDGATERSETLQRLTQHGVPPPRMPPEVRAPYEYLWGRKVSDMYESDVDRMKRLETLQRKRPTPQRGPNPSGPGSERPGTGRVRHPDRLGAHRVRGDPASGRASPASGRPGAAGPETGWWVRPHPPSPAELWMEHRTDENKERLMAGRGRRSIPPDNPPSCASRPWPTRPSKRRCGWHHRPCCAS